MDSGALMGVLRVPMNKCMYMCMYYHAPNGRVMTRDARDPAQRSSKYAR